MEKPLISILAVDDEEAFLSSLRRLLELHGYYVNTAPDGRVAINMLQTLPFDLALLDIMMPNVEGTEVLRFIKEQHFDTEVIMVTGVHEVRTAVGCMKLGAFYYITKPFEADDLLALIERAIERKRLLIHNRALRRQIADRTIPSNIVGGSKALLVMLDLAYRTAPTDSTVLIQGASGTGKELVANLIHLQSRRKEQAFLAVNCSSIPESLLESELFGHEKGAFTDARTTKKGLVEIADGGTLFLDEIGEMPLSIQPKVLRFLQTGEFRRVGGNKNLNADVRIVSATNKDLRLETEAKRFREDLFYRLNVITLQLPPLKDRREDIPLLVDHFLASHAGPRKPKQIEGRALELLMQYDWPGNVRELENVIARADILSQDTVICLDDLAMPLRQPSLAESGSGGDDTAVRAGSALSLLDIQKAHVAGVLASVNWDKQLASEILGIRLNTLYGKIRSYRIKQPE